MQKYVYIAIEIFCWWRAATIVGLVQKLSLWVIAATLLVAMVPELAYAQDDAPTIAVHVEGVQAKKFREVVIDTVPEGVEVLPEAKFRSGLQRAGLPGGKMGYAVTSPNQRRLLLRVIKKSIQSNKVDGAVIGRARMGPKGIEMVTLFVDPEGEVTIDEKVSLKGKESDQKAAITAALAEVYASLAPAVDDPEPEDDDPFEEEDEEEEEEEEEEEDDDEESDFKPNRVGSELFSIGLSAEFGGRFFSYNEPCSGPDNPCAGTYRTLRPFDIFGAPGLHVSGEIFPVAPWDVTFISDLGITLSYAHFFGVEAQTESNAEELFAVSWNRFTAGLRYRLRIGDKDDYPVTINPEIRFGFLNFTFEADGAAAQAIMDEVGTVEYTFIRGGLDVRLPLGEVFALMPSVGFGGPLSSGESFDRVNGASVLAFDAGLMFAFVLGLGIETRAGVEYTRYFASFDPQPTDEFVAGGATDQYLGLRVGAAYVF